jgi:hypothetical protein
LTTMRYARILGMSSVVLAIILTYAVIEARSYLLAQRVDSAGMAPDATAESEARGNAIVLALAAHFRAKGSYPLQLADLVPDYIPALLPPVAGTRTWRYVVNGQRDQYQLSFGDGEFHYPAHFIRSNSSDGWYRDY